MSTVETVIWAYLLAGLIYGVYYCYYDRKRMKAEADQVWSEETPMREAPPAIFYFLCVAMVTVSLLVWPYFFVDNAIHDYKDEKKGKEEERRG